MLSRKICLSTRNFLIDFSQIRRALWRIKEKINRIYLLREKLIWKESCWKNCREKKEAIIIKITDFITIALNSSRCSTTLIRLYAVSLIEIPEINSKVAFLSLFILLDHFPDVILYFFSGLFKFLY